MNIIGTLGPSCCETQVLHEMFVAGMDGMRLNLSHCNLKDRAGWIANLHEAAREAEIEPLLIMDMQGPELRIGVMDQELELLEGMEISLGDRDLGAGIPVCEDILSQIRPGQEILLDDGKILLMCTDVEETCHALVVRGGHLSSRKSIALPGTVVSMPAVTDDDKMNIREALKYGVTGVMQPFVRGPEDLITLRKELEMAGAGELKVYAKIENQKGMEQLSELLPFADTIVIARGDLGNAMPLWILPAAQKEIAAVCREAGKPFMVATELLSSMIHSAVPTRAEVSDIFNAILDGADSLIVTGETAVGEHPVDVIRYLTNTALAAEMYLERKDKEGEPV